MKMNAESLAIKVHAAVAAFEATVGDIQLPDWLDAPEWMHESTIDSVLFLLKNPGSSDSALHDRWMKQRTDAGWKYGEKRCEVEKTNPCMAEFSKLPKYQQMKDAIVILVVEKHRDNVQF